VRLRFRGCAENDHQEYKSDDLKEEEEADVLEAAVLKEGRRKKEEEPEKAVLQKAAMLEVGRLKKEEEEADVLEAAESCCWAKAGRKLSC
jgi:hypothetical protein